MLTMRARAAGQHLRVWLVLAALALAAAPTVQAASGRHSIPLVRNGDGYIVTPVSLNGEQEMPAIIDTAATFAMIEARTARAAGIAAPAALADNIEVFGLLGSRTFPIIHLGQIEAGSVRLQAVEAAYNGLEPMPGARAILPASAFAGDILDFDFPSGRLTVYNGRPQPRVAGLTSRMPLSDFRGLLFTEVVINGQTGKALIDTGSPVSIINEPFARAARVTPNARKTRELQGATGGLLPAEVASARRLELGRLDYSWVDLIVADPALFAELGLDDTPAMVLGLDILSALRMQIDRRSNELHLTFTPRNVHLRLNAPGSRLRR
jgi:predicted aspartyl protease